MQKQIIDEIKTLNPWLQDKTAINQLVSANYIQRTQTPYLLQPEWDDLWLILVGPRQAGKTTLGKYICKNLIKAQRYPQLIYLNCDITLIRDWLQGVGFINQLQDHFELNEFILFIDEVQRLQNPGLTLKAIYDLKLPIKLIASGSSQLEIKSKVQEHLTGRHLEAIVLPLSQNELAKKFNLEETLIFGSYPQVVTSTHKETLLQQLYKVYINKDIIEVLKIRNADLMEKILGLIAHSNGQLINYQRLATDCKSTIPTVQKYLSILEKTYVLHRLKPFVGNKRQEITSNPVYYFIDNGFRNTSLNNYTEPTQRADLGLLVESLVLQSIIKYKTQNFKIFNIHYWRTKNGAEVDFVLYKNDAVIIPIEVKHRSFTQPKITRAMRSFISSYQSKIAFVITKDYYAKEEIEGCLVEWLPVDDMERCFGVLDTML